MSIVMVIIGGFFAMLFVGGILLSYVTNHFMSQPTASTVMICFLALWLVAIISRIRFRRENPEQDAKEGRIMALVGAAIVGLVALSNWAKKNKR